MGERITERKLRNKRFRRTEEAIILAFFTARELLSAERLIKLAGISRSTLYRHHHTIYEIAPDYERYILKKYKKFVQRFKGVKQVRLKQFYQKFLIFLRAHYKIIIFLLKYGSPNLIEKMLLTSKSKIPNLKKINNEIFIIYTKEISGIIEDWLFKGADKNEILPTVHKIIYLTNSAKARLAPIMDMI